MGQLARTQTLPYLSSYRLFECKYSQYRLGKSQPQGGSLWLFLAFSLNFPALISENSARNAILWFSDRCQIFSRNTSGLLWLKSVATRATNSRSRGKNSTLPCQSCFSMSCIPSSPMLRDAIELNTSSTSRYIQWTFVANWPINQINRNSLYSFAGNCCIALKWKTNTQNWKVYSS